MPPSTPPFALGLSHIDLAGLDSFVELTAFVEALDAQNLHSSIAMDNFSLAAGLVLGYNYSATADVVANAAPPSVLTVQLDMDATKFAVNSTIMYNQNTFGSLDLQQLTQVSCLASAADLISLSALSFDFDGVALSLYNDTKIVGFDFLAALLKRYLPPPLLRKVLDITLLDLHKNGMVVKLINQLIGGSLANSSNVCHGAASPTPAKSNWSSEASILTVGFSLIVAFMVLGIGIYFACKRARCKVEPFVANAAILLPASEQPAQEGAMLNSDSARQLPHSCLARFDQWMAGSLLYEDRRVALWIRGTIPFILMSTLLLFTWSQTAVTGAAVTIQIQYSGTVIFHTDVFDFDLANSVKQMWQASVYPLSILIAVCSGGWPYLKCLLCLAAWCLPPAVLPLKTRGTLLEALDALGKWSLVDSFVLVMVTDICVSH